MNITREDAVRLPDNGFNIIATIYWKVYSVNLKTGEVVDDYEEVMLAQGYPSEDNPNEYLFHFVPRSGLYVEEWSFNTNGYGEYLSVDSLYDDTGDPVQTYSLEAVTDYVVITGIRVERTHICKVSDNADIYDYDSVKMECRNSKGKILWEFMEEE